MITVEAGNALVSERNIANTATAALGYISQAKVFWQMYADHQCQRDL